MAAQFQGGLATNSQCRVILLLDMDCFYCQVEQKRLGIETAIPCAVQQWEGLIAVNYAARAKGITRHMRVQEAKARCPELVLMHVEVIGVNGRDSAESDCVMQQQQTCDVGRSSCYASTAEPSGTSSSVASRQTHKACLERYRVASASIMGLLRKLSPGATAEKASIDEIYLDVTALVEAELGGESPPGFLGGNAGTRAFGWGGVTIEGPLRVENEFERRLSAGAMIACRLRGAVRERLGYTMSAGIACNKLLAKVASGLHKPDQQTIVPPRAAEALLAGMPLGKIRNFGGKLGAELQAMGCATPGEVAKLSAATLQARFGEKARWIAAAVRGISDDAVQEKELPKSMLAAKSFQAISDWGAIRKWLAILAAELASRMESDAAANNRYPRNLVLHYRASSNGTNAVGRSKSCGMPHPNGNCPSAEDITAAALKLAHGVSDLMPCFNLSIAATEFVTAPVSQKRSIQRFFVVPAGASCDTSDAAGPDDNPSAVLQGGQHRDMPAKTALRASQGTIHGMFSRAAARQAVAAPGQPLAAAMQRTLPEPARQLLSASEPSLPGAYTPVSSTALTVAPEGTPELLMTPSTSQECIPQPFGQRIQTATRHNARPTTSLGDIYKSAATERVHGKNDASVMQPSVGQALSNNRLPKCLSSGKPYCATDNARLTVDSKMPLSTLVPAQPLHTGSSCPKVNTSNVQHSPGRAASAADLGSGVVPPESATNQGSASQGGHVQLDAISIEEQHRIFSDIHIRKRTAPSKAALQQSVASQKGGNITLKRPRANGQTQLQGFFLPKP